ncbi:ArsR/SmtB family transcription factor [Brevibacterium jeotgali]|uniref:ArsR family transcriptional regulator n=1 Tax=Brevibacterium jeotgali TaxID=1262550 RepID=A0A2H1L6Z7_9MICO|nr:metalloregulator ArsR/SmtB family transcription factor [Brevibacterium jeotgali]TWC02273.1 ArsR family transcriptional regulator [Brevibacterium jeotgali]SMY12676.1 ArsR family transcriptional regulator [Brevibacterium jeotgali]
MSIPLKRMDAGVDATSECCTLDAAPLGADDAGRVAKKLKALADPTRLRLLSHVAAQGCDAVCACDLVDVLDISQPTISHHMKKLVEAGLLTREQRGKWAHYTVTRDAFDELRRFLDLR